MKSFSERLKFYINELELGVYEAAKQMQISPRTLFNYLNEETLPNGAFGNRLRILIPNYNRNWLFDGIGEPYINTLPPPPKNKKEIAQKTSIPLSAISQKVTSKGTVNAVTSDQIRAIVQEEFMRLKQELQRTGADNEDIEERISLLSIQLADQLEAA